MEEAPYSSATAVGSGGPNFLRPRNVPDVPEDVDFLMEHLNDPNYDLRRASFSSASTHSFEMDSKHPHDRKRNSTDYKGSEFDSESQADYSTERAGSRISAIDFDDESPYPEVRAAVASIDDTTMPVNTFRTWFLGLFYTCLISGLNQFFSMRYPSVLLTGVIAQLTSLPLGKGLERILPTRKFRTLGYTWSFNPGPFNIKEHVVITVMSNVVVFGAYATDIIATQRVFYGQNPSFSYQMLLILSVQLCGFSLAGILRNFLVWPSSMIWPGALVNAALFNTLHKNYGRKETKHISREKFFLIALTCSFMWYWVPGYLWSGLSFFNWVCWIAPNNVVVNQLFGTVTGLGMSILTFDWSQISYIGSPLVTPWWSEANTAASLVFCFWFLVPIIYYTNTWFSKYLPISAHYTFDNTGVRYDPQSIVTNGVFDVQKYRAHSPMFIPVTLTMNYATSFAAFTAVIVHAILWYRRDIVKRFRNSLKDERDVHSRLMQAYNEVPRWWYAVIGVVSMIMGITATEIFPTGLPVWALFLGFMIASVLSLPVGMIQAITNQQIPLSVMAELIGGYLLEGRPVANMIFKAVTYIGTAQAVTFSGDLKLGHYMKIPPRIMFVAQVLAALVSCFVVCLVQNWMFANITDFCSPDQKNGFICPSTNTFATASLVWGGVGPRRLFSPGAMYSSLLWFFLAGALLPIPFFLLAHRYPLSFWRYVNIPVFFAGVGAIPPASGINYSSWALTGFIFNYCVRRYHFRWWMRYNYILSAALDAGVAISMVVIFFATAMPKGGINLNWWGNEVWMNTADALGAPLYSLQPGETFGPAPGTWH